VLGVAIVVVGTVAFLFLPRVGLVLARRDPPVRWPPLPWPAAVLFVVSWLLPNPDLEHTSTFVQHAVGGGAACAVAAHWFAVNAGVRSRLLRVLLAFAVTASFGTAFELVELAYDEATGSRLGADTSWDLAANTTGAVLTAVLLEAVTLLRGRSSSRPARTAPPQDGIVGPR
jgi:hypothetical protein